MTDQTAGAIPLETLILIHNEQTKLFAAALDRTSTACVTLGVLGPIAIATFGTGSIATDLFIVCYILLELAFRRWGITFICAASSAEALMNGIQIFAFAVLPFLLIVGGYLSLRWFERTHPRPQIPANLPEITSTRVISPRPADAPMALPPSPARR
jgi:hypothetical protein